MSSSPPIKFASVRQKQQSLQRLEIRSQLSAFTCSEVQRCGFTSCHVLCVHVDGVHQLLHPGNVSVAAGFKKLPESSVATAAAAARVGRRARTAAPAGLGGRRGASAAASSTAATAACREGRSRRGGGVGCGRGRGDLTVCRLHCSPLRQGAAIVPDWQRGAGRAAGERRATRRGGRQGVQRRLLLLLLESGATRRRHFSQHNNRHQQQQHCLLTASGGGGWTSGCVFNGPLLCDQRV